jgi:hypothetical protein
VKVAQASGVVELDDEEIPQFIEINKAVNAVRKTGSDLNIWSRWYVANCIKKVNDIPASEL